MMFVRFLLIKQVRRYRGQGAIAIMVRKKKGKEGKRGKRGKEKKKRGKKRRKKNTYDRMTHPILSWGNRNCVTHLYVLPGMSVNPGGQGQGDTISNISLTNW